VLCLAAAGGQQAPILAAAGAEVVSFDNSDEQLALDQLVATRDGLTIQCVRGDMADLSALPSGHFDLIFHPVSNLFVPDLQPVWAECHRVLHPAGSLLAGFMNPAFFLFDHAEARKAGRLQVKFRLPYSDVEALPASEVAAQIKKGAGIEFSHSLTAQIGGQLKAGFVLLDLYEDDWNDEATPLNAYMPTYLATLSRKQAHE
jgi:SAM-dependent methyltransferase